MATAARLHGLVWRVRYVARNMLDRSTSVVHAWTEQGGLKGPREDLARPQVMQMTSAVVAVPGSKAGESWESGGAIA